MLVPLAMPVTVVQPGFVNRGPKRPLSSKSWGGGGDMSPCPPPPPSIFAHDVSSSLVVPKWVVAEINNICFEFIWNGKDRIKRAICYQDYGGGGL